MTPAYVVFFLMKFCIRVYILEFCKLLSIRADRKTNNFYSALDDKKENEVCVRTQVDSVILFICQLFYSATADHTATGANTSK